jgi:D-glycero-D-manno-heptose 1,7-bisphosphate phosphatase
VVSNQSGVGRGYFEQADVEAVHDRLQAMLKAEGVGLDAYFYCPHAPDQGCVCRKPATGMALAACARFGVSPRNCVMVGDSVCDAEFGLALEVPTFIIGSARPGVHSIKTLDEVLPLLL